MNNEQMELLYEEEENQFSLEIEALLQKFIGVESIVCVFDHIGETDRFKAGFVQSASDERVLLTYVQWHFL